MFKTTAEHWIESPSKHEIWRVAWGLSNCSISTFLYQRKPVKSHAINLGTSRRNNFCSQDALAVSQSAGHPVVKNHGFLWMFHRNTVHEELQPHHCFCLLQAHPCTTWVVDNPKVPFVGDAWNEVPPKWPRLIQWNGKHNYRPNHTKPIITHHCCSIGRYWF